MTDYGKDIRLGKTVSTESGINNLITSLLRRLQTPKGGLFYDPSYGEDVRMYLNSPINDSRLAEIKFKVKTQLELDERVREVSPTVSFDLKTSKLVIRMNVILSDSTEFSLIIGVDKLDIELLSVNI